MKKCNRKKIVGIIVLACLLLALIAVVLFAFFRNRTAKINVIENGDEYDWQYVKAFAGEKDAGMNIDGELTEEFWLDRNWLTHVEMGVSMRYTTAFTDKGLYIAAVAEDQHMQWNDTRAFMNNSSFRFYVVSNTADQYYCFDCISFYVDEKDSSCRQQTRFEAKAVRSVNEDGVPTLTAEFFATWEDLNYEVNTETGLPEFARIVPMYRYVEGFESADNAFLKPAFAEVDNDRVRNALLFNQNGYINVDREGAELGNAGNGFAKSDGWDLSDLDGGEDGIKTVNTTVENGQAIFFKEIYSSRYSYSVDMKLKGGINDLYPTAGVCDMKSASEFNCMRIAGTPYFDSGNKTLTYYLLDFYETLWHDVLYGDRTEAKGSDTINIRVIKDDTRYYYIFNGVYEFSVDLDWLGGKTCPGLYSLGADVEFINWQVTDYEGDDMNEAFSELVDEYMYVVKVSANTSGGTLSLDKLAIRKGSNESVNLTARPSKGYILTDILINGKSEYERLIPTMKDGVIELHPTESMYIEAVFSPLPMESCIRITGQVLRSNGAVNIGLPYKVQSNDYKLLNLLFFYDSTTTAGNFDILLLRAGEYEIGGRKFTTNGVYTLNFEGIFPKGEKNVFTIDTKESKYKGLTYYDWGAITLNPLKVANMAERANGDIQTTNTGYRDTYSYYIYNEEIQGSFRLETTATANNDNWPCYGFTIEDESNNSIQFFAGGSTTYRIMANYNGLYTQSDKGATFVDNQCNMVLVYDENTDMFYFYVNNVLFDKVKRSNYLSGTTFRYGIVGYMSGADGSPRSVTYSDPYAIFSKPALTQKFSVSVPKGATLTLNGKKISGQNVPVLSEVTVTIPVSTGKQYIIYVDGKPLETRHKNGKITASFIVTGKHQVTYAEAYITEWIHDQFEYDVATGGYRVSDHNKTANGGYLTGTSIPQGSPFLLETTVRDMDTELWPSVGLIVGTGKDNYVRFSIIRNTDVNPNVYAIRVGNAAGKEIVKWFSDIETLQANQPFGANGSGDMQLGLVYQNGYYYVYVNGVLATTYNENDLLSSEISIKNSLGNGNLKLGLFAERKVTFADWNYSTDISKYMAGMPDMEWIHSPFVYDSATGSYRVTDHNSVANGGYFADSALKQGTSFLLETTVRNMDTELWPSVGLIVGNSAKNYVRFSVIRNTDATPNVYALRVGNANGKEIVKWFSDIDTLKDNQPFGANGSMKLSLVYHSGYYFVYVNEVLATTLAESKLLSGEISIKDSLGDDSIKLGLFAERKVTFEDWSYSSAMTDIGTYIGRTVTVVDGMTVSVNGETRGNGTVYLKETATVSMTVSEGEDIRFLVDGGAVETTIENGTATASFTVTGDHSVTYASAYAVSGKVSADRTVDITAVEVTITNENGQTAKTVNPDASGNFTANLANGTYYVSAKNGVLMSGVETIVVADAPVSGASLTLYKPLLSVQTGVYTYDFKTGYYTTPASIADNRAYMGTVAQGTPFVLEAEIRDMTMADYPSVGFRIETGGENYLYFNLRYDSGAGVYQYWLKRWPWAEYGNIERLTAFPEGSWMRTTPFKDGTLKMALVYRNGYYYAFFNGELAFKMSETEALDGGSIQDAIGKGDRRLNLFAEREVTFVDWNYSTDVSNYVDSTEPVKLESAQYKNQWGGDTSDFVYEPENGIYRGLYGWYNTGVLEKPASVTASDEWVLEADVQIIADWQYPSVGFALYNGSNFAQNVKFEIVRTTPEPYGDYSGHVWQLRVNGKDYVPNAGGNSTAIWLAQNQNVLKGKVHLAVAHVDGEYRMFINGICLCEITGEEAAGLTDGWGSIRPGFYAEQEATFENWNYSAKQEDVEKYRR